MTQVVCYLKKCIHNEDNVCTKDIIMLDDKHFCDGGCDDGWEFAQKEDNDYIRRKDAVDEINVNADGLEQNGGIPYAQGARAMAIVVEQMPPADVLPYSIDPDGTLTITVPKGTKRIGRILIEEDETRYGGMFYPDTGGCFLSSMEGE